MVEKKRLIVIDSNSLIHRAFHALPPLKTKKGELVNALYGFCLIFLKALKEFKPDFIAAAFDVKGPTFRHKEFIEYKAKRPKAPDELYQQIGKVKEVLESFKVPIFEKQGFEADDIIGTISKSAPKKQVYPEIETIILSGDLDNLQLIDKNTKVYTLKKGIKDTVLYDENSVQERYGGLNPSQLIDFKSLRGDPSDNIPGVTGIGEKTAVQLIKEFGSLENLYKEINEKGERSQKIKKGILEKLINYKEQAFLSKQLVEIKTNVPIAFNLNDCRFGNYKSEDIVKVLKNFEFYALINRLAGIREKIEREEIKSPLSEGVRQRQLMFGTEKDVLEKDDLIEKIKKLEEEGVFSKKIADLERKLIKVVEKMENNGIKIDKDSLAELSESLGGKIQDLESQIYKMADAKFNINSSQQLSKILFEGLKISSKGLKKTPGGVVSTGAEELEKLKNSYPIVNLILKYREIFKLKSGFVDALPKMILKKDGRLHPHFHQLGTETGRMSCSAPNLQNIPVKGEFGKEIRRCFVVEKGFKLVSADYAQTELRIAASLSQDEKMIELFKKGEDAHKLTASRIFKVPEKEVTEGMRYLAKTLNFGVLYGMGPQGFSQRTGLSVEESRKFISKYFENFRRLSRYIENAKEEAREKGYVETLFGRKRFLPEINSIDPRLKSAAERMAVNMKIQGFAADIMKLAMVEIDNSLIFNFKRGAEMILQVHDELLFEVKKNIVNEVASKIKEIMENIVELEVPLKVDIKVGDNWGEL